MASSTARTFESKNLTGLAGMRKTPFGNEETALTGMTKPE
jgi:hypothetical protein